MPPTISTGLFCPLWHHVKRRVDHRYGLTPSASRLIIRIGGPRRRQARIFDDGVRLPEEVADLARRWHDRALHPMGSLSHRSWSSLLYL